MGFVRAAEPPGDARPEGHGLRDVALAGRLPGHLIARGPLPHAQSRQLPPPGGVLQSGPAEPTSWPGRRCGRCTWATARSSSRNCRWWKPSTPSRWPPNVAATAGLSRQGLLPASAMRAWRSWTAFPNPSLTGSRTSAPISRSSVKSIAANPVTLVEMNQKDLGKSTEAFRKYVAGRRHARSAPRPAGASSLAGRTDRQESRRGGSALPLLGGPADDRKARRPGRGLEQHRFLLAAERRRRERRRPVPGFRRDGRRQGTGRIRGQGRRRSRLPVPRRLGGRCRWARADRDRPGEVGSSRKREERLRQPHARRVDAAGQSGRRAEASRPEAGTCPGT